MGKPPKSRLLTQPAQQPLRLPRGTGNVVGTPTFNAAMQQLEQADAANTKRSHPPVVYAIGMIDDAGATWIVTVDTGGTLRTILADRT